MDAEALVGKAFGNCLLQQVIGAGTMGVVYRAMRTDPFSQVAVKVMTRAATLELAQQVAFLEMFRGAIKGAATLHHQHIVPVYDYDDSDGLAYAVMAEIQGETLEKMLARRGSLDFSQSLHFLEQIAEALDYAHAQGIVHRDLKPANIFITTDEQALVADFYLTSALVEESVAPMRLSRPGMLDYMSPELVVGKAVDGRADIYSLGAMLYRMVTGAPLFQGQTLMKVATKHLKMPPPSPRALRPDLPAAAEQALLRTLEKNPAERYATAQDFARSLRQAMQGDAPGAQLAQEASEASRVPQSPQESQKAAISRTEGESDTTRTFIPRGLSRLPQSPQSPQSPLPRPGRWRSAALTAMTSEGNTGDSTTDAFSFRGSTFAEQLREFPTVATEPRIMLEQDRQAEVGAMNTQPQVPAIAAKINPVTPAAEPPAEGQSNQASQDAPQVAPVRLMQQAQLTRKLTSALPPLALARQGEHMLGEANRATDEAAREQTGTTGMWKLPGPAKIVSIPIAGQPGQFVTGILPTQPQRQSSAEAPGLTPAARARQPRKKVVALALVALLVLLGSVSFWLVRGVITHQTGQGKTGQTAVSGTPNLGATATAQAMATLGANTILFDPLTQNIHDWPESSSGSILYQFKSDGYHISNNDPSRIAPAILLSETLGQPFAYTLTLDQIRGDDTSVNNEFGMIIRFAAQQKNGKQDISFYSFEVLNKKGGEYQFWKYDNSSGASNPWKQLAQHPLGPEYHQGLGAKNINTFTILVNGKNFTLIVNGKKVWSVSDGSLTGGSVGMLVNLKGTEVAFSDLRLTNS